MATSTPGDTLQPLQSMGAMQPGIYILISAEHATAEYADDDDAAELADGGTEGLDTAAAVEVAVAHTAKKRKKTFYMKHSYHK